MGVISHSCIWCDRETVEQQTRAQHQQWNMFGIIVPTLAPLQDITHRSMWSWMWKHFSLPRKCNLTNAKKETKHFAGDDQKDLKGELRTWSKDQRPSSTKLLQWGGICPNITSNASSHLEQDEDEFLIKMLIHSHKIYYQGYVSGQRQPQNKVSNTCVNTLCTAAVLQMILNKQWLVICRKRCNTHNSVHCLHAVPRPLSGHLNGALT